MSAIFLNSRFWIIVGIVIAAVWIANWFMDIGASGVVEEINNQNERAVNDADLGELSETECRARRSDGERVFYDFAAGKCRRR